MASTTNADGNNTDGNAGSGDAAMRLTQMCDRTSLMVIDGILRALPGDAAQAPAQAMIGLTNAAAADEVRELARRMLQATRDLRAAIHEPAE